MVSDVIKGAASPASLSERDFVAAAKRLGCDVLAIRAVWEVEAAGDHFLADGSVIRRFEPHHVSDRIWGEIGFSVRSGEAPWRASLRLSSEAMFQRAAALDLNGALEATSWGAPQIMGFNHSEAGFPSARDMVKHMAKGAPEQLGAFVQLIENWGLDGALRSHDWRTFARRYNGPGQVDRYAELMESAHRRHAGGKKSREVLAAGSEGASVRELQRAIGADVDGAFGPRTERAVRKFQRQNNLVEDGIVGEKTWVALDQAAKASGSDAPKPRSQKSRGDSVTDSVRDWAGAASAATAASAGVSGLIPDRLEEPLFIVAAVIAIGAAVIWGVRRLRE